MNKFYENALKIKDEIIKNRRRIHGYGGIGFELEETAEFVKQYLQGLGLEPIEICKSGIVCTIGQGDKCILLRADMDALPIIEESGLEFACTNGTMHACGHDMHAAMLLGAAKLLVQKKDELCGRVKLMFQPGEEILAGAEEMIKCGLLEDPKVDAALGMHVGVGRPDSYSGLVTYIIGPASTSADEFWITLYNKEQRMVNPITAGCRLLQGLQEISNIEIRPNEFFSMVCNVLDCNSDAANVTPTKATIKGVIRTTDNDIRDTAKQRLESIAKYVANAYNCDVEVEYVRGVGPMITDEKLCTELIEYVKEIVDEDKIVREEYGQGAEDFAAVCREVPGMFINLGAGHPSEGYTAANHKSTVIFNEDVLPLGAAIYATCAFNWLENHCK